VSQGKISRPDWSREEVELIVTDYFSMLAAELSGESFSKTEHRRNLRRLLQARSEGSIEFKHQNISAVLIDLGFPYVTGYLPRFNYQDLLYEIVAERLAGQAQLWTLAEQDAHRPAAVPTVDDILLAMTDPPARRVPPTLRDSTARRYLPARARATVNYLELEARNRSLGSAGEEFVVRFEQARLLRGGHDRLAARIDRVSVTRGDGAGFDVLSYDESGAERWIEVKTTKYGRETPFFLSRNEVEVSRESGERYHLYRVFEFRVAPRLFSLPGSLSSTCAMEPSQYIATVA
jgi:hypothetical protein